MAFEEFKEHSVRSGLGTALCYRMPSETKYHILTAVESLPPVAGSPETITFSSTTNRSITSVQGKTPTEQVEINIPYNIDTITIMDKIMGENISFAYIDLDDFSGQEFVAQPKYHLAEVGTDSIKTIVLTLTINSIEDTITKDLYDVYMDTLSFNEDIPSVIEMVKNSVGTSETSIKVVVAPDTTPTVSSSSASIATGTYDGSTKTVKITANAKGSAIITIKASLEDYADNERNIKVIVK